jgi:hypothetical protein
MRQFVCFQWFCIKDAWRGCWTKANEMGGLLGAGILWAVLFFLSPRLRENQLIEAPTTYLGVAGFTFLSAVGSVTLAFFVIFIARFVTAPARLYAELKATIPPVLKSDIHLLLDNEIAYEGGLVDAGGNGLPPAKIFSVRVSNAGDKFLQRCQITFGLKARFNYPVSGCFDLRIGEYKDLPVLRINHQSATPRPFVYFLRDTDWKILTDGPSWLPGQGTYEIQALSADTDPATIEVELSRGNGEWKLISCG